jgi:hypothetical protein
MSPTTELQRMTHSPLHPMPRQMPCQAAPSRSHCSGAAAPASSLASEVRQPKEDALFQPAAPRSQAPLPSPRASPRRRSPCHGQQRGRIISMPSKRPATARPNHPLQARLGQIQLARTVFLSRGRTPAAAPPHPRTRAPPHPPPAPQPPRRHGRAPPEAEKPLQRRISPRHHLPWGGRRPSGGGG